MADYGLQVRNESNLIQIDSTFQNLAFWTKGVAVASQATGFSSWRSGTITVPYTPASAFAFRADFPTFILNTVISGSTMQVDFLSYIVGGSAATIYWYLFAPPNFTGFPAGQNYGLRVKNAAGVSSFDSRNQYMKYLASLSGIDTDLPVTQDNAPPQFLSYTMPVGAVPAVLQGNLATNIAEVPTGVSLPDFMFFWQSSCVRQSGSVIGVASCVRVQGPYQQPINPPQMRRQPWNYTVIDVGGL
ncbi:hypothetical protein [Achromobacter sp. SLBN-14]|uniref:hypothetical protein n=1 Tax=Achromobacter sp. SLBN-14 TaxID=2768442 RepID=UPI00114D6DA0|nr:hypothetical protein [Achromobacter sp. SLBN-14]TQJ97333.1 hypothetical protein FBY20_4128 [Achromobacter sp. SLBN-14]